MFALRWMGTENFCLLSTLRSEDGIRTLKERIVMKCPQCKTGSAWVMGSREKEGSVRRRRRCTKCGFRFTTSEISVDDLKNIALMAAGIVNDIKKR